MVLDLMTIKNPPVADRIKDQTGATLLCYRYEIGIWNMDSIAEIAVPHNLASKFIDVVSISGVIINDAQDSVNPFGRMQGSTNGDVSGSAAFVNDTNIYIRRLTGGVFDSTSFDNPSMNRGYILLWVLQD